MKEVVKGIFFCIEGYYTKPEEADESDFSDDDEDVSFGSEDFRSSGSKRKHLND